MRLVNYFIIISLVIIISCTVSQKTLTGFKEEIEPVFLLFLQTISIENKFRSSGWFVDIEHRNGRKLTLFVPGAENKELNYRKIVDKIETSNNPNDWSFFYVDFKVPSIDSVITTNGSKVPYNFYHSVISQNLPFTYDTIKFKEYFIKYHYVNSAIFCQASIDIIELNKYNSVPRIQDGVRESKLSPFFIFKEENQRMDFLLPKSEFCH